MTASTRHRRPVVIVGAGPVGLVTALGLNHYGIPVLLLEDDDKLSLDTKAGTILTRTLEVLSRYGAVGPVLRESLRIDEIGDIDRATNEPRASVKTEALIGETRYPFVINIPQNRLEGVLERHLRDINPDAIRFNSRVTGLRQDDDGVTLTVEGPAGEYELEAQYVLGCDGGRSLIRAELGVEVVGKTLEQRYMLVDLDVDLDMDNPRDYPYLSYFSDPEEWMILVRQPHCWRFLFPLQPGEPEPDREALREKALRFIGEVDKVDILGTNIYSVHHRVADKWRTGRVFLMGDAAHLITPMWALGLNTGVLDASNLPWRLAWVLRGWADPALLDGYELEQSNVAIRGSGEMAENARQQMGALQRGETTGAAGAWGLAMTRTLLGVTLDVEGTGNWTMVKESDTPLPVRAGDRVPDVVLEGADGLPHHLHDLIRDSFVALHFTDTRRRPELPAPGTPGLTHYVVSRWDAPHDSGLRSRSLFDPANRVRDRLGVDEGAVVLLRPDAHIAAILNNVDGAAVEDLYARIVSGEIIANATEEGAQA